MNTWLAQYLNYIFEKNMRSRANKTQVIEYLEVKTDKHVMPLNMPNTRDLIM